MITGKALALLYSIWILQAVGMMGGGGGGQNLLCWLNTRRSRSTVRYTLEDHMDGGRIGRSTVPVGDSSHSHANQLHHFPSLGRGKALGLLYCISILYIIMSYAYRTNARSKKSTIVPA